MARHPPAALVDARGAAVDHRAAGIEVDHQPLPEHLVLAAVEPDVADQGDQLFVEVVDPEITLAVSDGLCTVTPPAASRRRI